MWLWNLDPEITRQTLKIPTVFGWTLLKKWLPAFHVYELLHGQSRQLIFLASARLFEFTTFTCVSFNLHYTCDLASLRYVTVSELTLPPSIWKESLSSNKRIPVSPPGIVARTPTLKRACLRLISIAGEELLVFTSTFQHAVLNVWSVRHWKVPERSQDSCVFVCMLCMHLCSTSGWKEGRKKRSWTCAGGNNKSPKKGIGVRNGTGVGDAERV